MNWIFLSILAAFGQALGWSIKKKSLKNNELDNSLGTISFGVAGLILFVIFFMMTGNIWIKNLTNIFWLAIIGVVLLNVIAVRSMYVALNQKIDFSALMPFMAITSLAIVPIEYWLNKTLPTQEQMLGIAMIVFGAIIFAIRSESKKDIRAIKYFIVTIICYSFAPIFIKIAVQESGSGIFAAAIFHGGIALGFFFLMILTGEMKIWNILHFAQKKKTLFVMFFAGVVMGLVENGPVAVALQSATASEVFALKRLMPIFATIIGYFYFKERSLTNWQKFGMICMMFGSVLITWFKSS